MRETEALIKGRLSYAYLVEPRKANDGQEPKYTTVVIIDKNDKKSLGSLKAAIEAVKASDKGKQALANAAGVIPGNIKTTLHDGDDSGRPECAGSYYINVSSRNKPLLLGRDRRPMNDDDARAELYSGCYAQVIVNLAPYNTSGNKGITAYMQAVMKWHDGERLGGATVNVDDFEILDDDSDDIEVIPGLTF